MTEVLADGTVLEEQPCPDCEGEGCEVCEGTGSVLVPAGHVRTVSSTPTTDSEDTRPEHVGSQGENVGDAEQEPEAKQSFGGLGPAEAARLRWVKERERNANAETVEAGGDVVVRTTVAVASIIKRLSADAQKGDTRAARELRAWMADVAIETKTNVSDLDERTRQEVLARLLREIEEEQAVPLAAPVGEATPASVGVPSSRDAEPLLATEQAETTRIEPVKPGVEIGSDVIDTAA